MASALGCDLNTAVTNQNTVVAVVFSTGKNGPLPHGANEAQNLDANPLFVSRVPDPPSAPGASTTISWSGSRSVLYGRMVAAGVLP